MGWVLTSPSPSDVGFMEALITPAQLLSRLYTEPSLAALFLGRGSLQDRMRLLFASTSARWTLYQMTCVCVDAAQSPEVEDERVTAVRVPQLRIFQQGQLVRLVRGFQAVEREILQPKPPF